MQIKLANCDIIGGDLSAPLMASDQRDLGPRRPPRASRLSPVHRQVRGGNGGRSPCHRRQPHHLRGVPQGQAPKRHGEDPAATGDRELYGPDLPGYQGQGLRALNQLNRSWCPQLIQTVAALCYGSRKLQNSPVYVTGVNGTVRLIGTGRLAPPAIAMALSDGTH